jgi:hypothetical protein
VQTNIPTQVASKCLTDKDTNLGILNVNFRAGIGGDGDGTVGAFVGMEGSPVTGTIEFGWEACEPEPVKVELPADDKC